MGRDGDTASSNRSEGCLTQAGLRPLLTMLYNVYSHDGIRKVGEVTATSTKDALDQAKLRWYLPMVRRSDWRRFEQSQFNEEY